jgi:selenide,water dikinase
VTGTVRSDRIVTNANARPGDKLVLTKPIGTGIIATAAKAQRTDEATLGGAVSAMRQLNRAAAEAMLAAGANAATDVTGFGLAGHLLSMMRASKTTAHLRLADVPLLPGTRDLAETGLVPGGTKKNLESLAGAVLWDAHLTEVDRLILADAQTSGGLLVSIGEDRVGALLAGLRERDTLGAVVGEVSAGGGTDSPSLEITP